MASMASMSVLTASSASSENTIAIVSTGENNNTSNKKRKHGDDEHRVQPYTKQGRCQSSVDECIMDWKDEHPNQSIYDYDAPLYQILWVVFCLLPVFPNELIQLICEFANVVGGKPPSQEHACAWIQGRAVDYRYVVDEQKGDDITIVSKTVYRSKITLESTGDTFWFGTPVPDHPFEYLAVTPQTGHVTWFVESSETRADDNRVTILPVNEILAKAIHSTRSFYLSLPLPESDRQHHTYCNASCTHMHHTSNRRAGSLNPEISAQVRVDNNTPLELTCQCNLESAKLLAEGKVAGIVVNIHEDSIFRMYLPMNPLDPRYTIEIDQLALFFARERVVFFRVCEDGLLDTLTMAFAVSEKASHATMCRCLGNGIKEYICTYRQYPLFFYREQRCARLDTESEFRYKQAHWTFQECVTNKNKTLADWARSFVSEYFPADDNQEAMFNRMARLLIIMCEKTGGIKIVSNDLEAAALTCLRLLDGRRVFA